MGCAPNERFPSTAVPSLSKLEMLFLCAEWPLSTIRAIYQPSSQIENLSQGPWSLQGQINSHILVRSSLAQWFQQVKHVTTRSTVQTLLVPQSHMCHSEIQKALRSGSFSVTHFECKTLFRPGLTWRRAPDLMGVYLSCVLLAHVGVLAHDCGRAAAYAHRAPPRSRGATYQAGSGVLGPGG